jgi:environmental stress-induced protein Ves
LEIIRASDCVVMPWKNGGGSTTEIAIAPAGASLDAFDWRISMARVASDGPFSKFAGIDRTLAVVEGLGIILSVGSNAPVMLAGAPAQISFSGDIPASAWLIDGEITDLNIMTARGRFSHRLQRVRQPLVLDFANGDDIAVVLSLNGSTTLAADASSDVLQNGDAAVLRRSDDAAFQIQPQNGCDCYLILLRQI